MRAKRCHQRRRARSQSCRSSKGSSSKTTWRTRSTSIDKSRKSKASCELKQLRSSCSRFPSHAHQCTASNEHVPPLHTLHPYHDNVYALLAEIGMNLVSARSGYICDNCKTLPLCPSDVCSQRGWTVAGELTAAASILYRLDQPESHAMLSLPRDHAGVPDMIVCRPNTCPQVSARHRAERGSMSINTQESVRDAHVLQ